MDRHVHLVTLTANAEGKLSALVDLEETTLDRAVMLLRWAKTDGTYEQIEEVRLPEPTPVAAAPIGNPTARLAPHRAGPPRVPHQRQPLRGRGSACWAAT